MLHNDATTVVSVAATHTHTLVIHSLADKNLDRKKKLNRQLICMQKGTQVIGRCWMVKDRLATDKKEKIQATKST